MDSIQMMVIGRGIERLFISSSAILSIYFGYKLFRSGIDAVQVGDIRFLGWVIALKQVGPGIFFALFGTILLSVSAMNNIKFENSLVKNEETGVQQQNNSVSFFGSADDQLRKAQVKGLQSAISAATCEDINPCPDRIPLKNAKLFLEALRKEILEKKLGDDILVFWDSNKQAFASGQVKDEKVLQKLNVVAPWFEGSE